MFMSYQGMDIRIELHPSRGKHRRRMIHDFPRNPTALLQMLSISIPKVLGEKVVGLYVYGSLVTGGYDDRVSDVDLLAVTTEDLDDETLERLCFMHTQIEKENPQWSNRVEVAYLSTDGLRSFKTRASPMINISPGEPIHRIQAGMDWLVNWYLVRTGGVTLLGPPPDQLVPEISNAEFIGAVGANAHHSAARSAKVQDRRSQSYAILTMCRAVHTLETGQHHSKQDSAQWARRQFPGWSDLIDIALTRRREPDNAPRLPLHPDGSAFLGLLRKEVLKRS